MATKLKAEAERQDWQLLFMLAGRGYNDVCAQFAEQLNLQIDKPLPTQTQQQANGEDRDAPPPRQ